MLVFQKILRIFGFVMCLEKRTNFVLCLQSGLIFFYSQTTDRVWESLYSPLYRSLKNLCVVEITNIRLSCDFSFSHPEVFHQKAVQETSSAVLVRNFLISPLGVFDVLLYVTYSQTQFLIITFHTFKFVINHTILITHIFFTETS